jgi:anti-sigma factor RsiW
MKCQEMLRALGDFVDGELAPAICEEFEKHLAGCDACQVVIDTMRRTITICREGRPVELPPAFRRRLDDALREKWRSRFPGM